jgi:hypothetical protein
MTKSLRILVESAVFESFFMTSLSTPLLKEDRGYELGLPKMFVVD